MGAREDLNGLWEGSFSYFASEDIGETRFKARIKIVEGQLSGITVESDFMSGGDLKADIKGTVEGDKVTFVKRYMREGPDYARPVTYEGRLESDNRMLAGSWTHSDGSGPFEMCRP